MSEIPETMVEELGAWNDGAGISLRDWVGCEGSFSLAVGYAAIFWPRFVAFEGYVLREGFSVESLRGFERQDPGTRRGIEAVMNHLHIADIQVVECPDLTRDKILLLGDTLTEIHRVKLRHDFPDRTFEVSFHQPEDRDDLLGYELSFWQR